MLDISADIAPPRPVRLDEYRPPAFLIDTVDLVFEIGRQRHAGQIAPAILGAIRRTPSARQRCISMARNLPFSLWRSTARRSARIGINFRTRAA